MSYELDMNKLATMVRYQRAHRPFRQIAAELGDVSASTLNRLEAGKRSDLVVFLRVCSCEAARAVKDRTQPVYLGKCKERYKPKLIAASFFTGSDYTPHPK